MLLCFFMVSLVCLISLVGVIHAQNLEYQAENYEASIIPTIDGGWTTPDEWSDAEEYQLGGSLDVIFRLKKVTNGLGQLQTLYFLIEFFNDTTNDSTDYTRIGLVSANTPGGVPEGGEAPDENCIYFEYKGHDVNYFTYSRGFDDGWVVNSTYTWNTDILVVDSFDTSPLSDQPHLIVEWRISAPAFNIRPDLLLRVGAYDATDGILYHAQIWPFYANVNVPNQWGLVVMHNETIPEISICTALLMFLTMPIIVTLARKMKKKS